MKVSEAMRLADEMGIPDLRGKFIETNLSKWIGEKPPCCAIGGASVASRTFRFERDDATNRLTAASVSSAMDATGCDDWRQFIAAGCSSCPAVRPGACASWGMSLCSVTTHLYDDHGWSRTQIADWLDSLDAEAQP